MPWTFAHPAAVLPFRRLCPAHLSLAGLVVGSVTPDLGYYVGLGDPRGMAHSPLGLLTICLPVGLALLVLWRLLSRHLIFLLPQPHRDALLSLVRPLGAVSMRRLWVAAVSVLSGALTHVAWDAFTHGPGAVVSRIGFLRMTLFHWDGRDIQVHNVLQHFSTAAGIACLALCHVHLLRRATPADHALDSTGDRSRYLLMAAFAVLALAGAGLMTSLQARAEGGGMNVSVLLVRTVIHATTVFAVLVAVSTCAVAWHRR